MKTIINDVELTELKQSLQSADLILFPVIFDVGQAVGVTYGRATFRLYDLNAGDFVHQCKTTFNVNMTEENAIRLVTALLLVEEKSCLIDPISK
ncbi:MAG: hypothetical protein AAFX87_14045 [Bacteroidota bacterium]